MASVTSFASMRASALTIMATRSQDQHLVAQVASSHGAQEPILPSSDTTKGGGDGGSGCKVIPSFGWHPWFSYQLYDDSATEPTYKPNNDDDSDEEASNARKATHYQAVLSPSPDQDFISSLPHPIPISSFLSTTRKHLESFPRALIGEVGLDKAFRLPEKHGDPADPSSSSSSSSPPPPRDDSLTPGGREGRLLSPYRVRMAHQQTILWAQLRLAGEVGRAVSVHGVQAHGVLYDTISALWKGHELKVLSRRERKMVAPNAEDFDDSDDDNDNDDNDNDSNEKPSPRQKQPLLSGKPFPPRICLHSYSGSPDMLKQWVHPSVPSQVFVSFSTAVNLGSRTKLADVVRAVPDDRILVESDLHVAGGDMDAALEDMYRLVCEVKGWDVEDGVRRIGRNYNHFIFG
ncbi:Cut9-interacting protein scn1 [Cladobotryum mycophilum]|uniref:Cut9-interacting protein scn1 n=1 Tax=Cladobotryum mycophilum TaxID=491253 RepID=A0ABR0T2T7_9HYPO